MAFNVDAGRGRDLGWRARKYRYHLSVLVCLVFSAWIASPAADYWTRLGGDLFLPLTEMFYGEGQGDSPVVLVVIDEVTHNTAPFSETPEVAWTPYLADLITAIDEGGASVIGLDMIFPKTIAGRGLAPGFDRPFLQALAKAGRAGKLVLAEARLSETPIRPYEGQVLAVGGAGNVRPVHLTPDQDDVVRRHPAVLPLENGENIASFAAELSARSGVKPNSDILIDYVTPADDFPTYRFSDLLACLEKGEVFDVFAGKTVLIGTALDIEDRHVGANRFQQKKAPQILASPCGGMVVEGRVLNRASTPGVFVEARATYTFLQGTGLKILPRSLTFLLALALLAGLVFVFFRVGPALGFLALLLTASTLWVAAAALLAAKVLAPALPLSLAGAALFILLYSYRVILEDHSKRWVTHAFQYYLSPSLVDRLAEDPEALQLGGERRRAVILFADLAGFTSTSEALADQPEALVSHLNEFFEIMVGEIERHDGYVDKFIGDAVMAVWGAPLDMDNPEQAAAEAALACAAAVDRANTVAETKLNMRIGVAAGDVIAGNLGSKGRFNYTVIGDAVNRASRLEQENKRLGTRILIDEAVAARLTGALSGRARFLEEIALRGQTATTKIYTLDAHKE